MVAQGTVSVPCSLPPASKPRWGLCTEPVPGSGEPGGGLELFGVLAVRKGWLRGQRPARLHLLATHMWHYEAGMQPCTL